MPDRIIYLLFALSGVSGLIYEGTWARYLKMFLGHSSYGQLLTLVIYMGGLGLGSFLAAKLLPRIRNPFRAYAMTEFVIGVGALLYHFLYLRVTDFFYQAAWSAHWGSASADAIKIGLSIAITTPWAILLGMTFPFLASGLARKHQDQGSLSVPRLYFTNSAGAAIGLLLASFWFIPHWGTQGTLILGAVINFAIGAYFWGQPLAVQNAELTQKTKDTEVPSRIWLAIALVTGLTSFVYEVVWIRLLSLMMGSSTHSFDQMVSAFIVGLALGAWVSRRFAKLDSLRILAWVQVLMGLMAISTLYTYPLFFDTMNGANMVFRDSDAGYGFWSIFKYGLALLWMVPTSFFAGMTLPLLTWSLTKAKGGESSVGAIYGFNTLGAISGALLAGLFLIPQLQLKWSLWLAAMVDVLMGVFLLWKFRREELQRVWLWVALLVCIPGIVVQFDAHMVTAGMFRGHKDYLRFEKVKVANGKTATISFHEGPLHSYIKTNGKPDASIRKDRSLPVEGDEITQAATAFIPMATRNQPYDAGMVGFGSGMGAYYLLADPLLKSLDIVEIEGKMLELAEHFRPTNARAFDDPRVHLYVDDARTFFHTHGKQYDILVSVPSNPWVSGVSSLFSEEFYRQFQRYLKPKGVLVQWLQLYEFDNELLLRILKALHNAFPYVTMYRVPDEPDIILLASDHPIRQQYLDRFAQQDSIRNEFSRMHRPIWYFGEQNFLATGKALEPWLNQIDPNSEFIPWVDNQAEQARWADHSVFLTNAFDSTLANWSELLDPQDFAYRKAERARWPQAIQPNAYLRENLLHHLKLLRLGQGNDAIWEKIWEDYTLYSHQIPLVAIRDQDSVFQFLRDAVRDNQVPLAYSLQFEFEDHMVHGEYAQALQMVATLKEVFLLGTMNGEMLRQIAIASFLSQDTRELRSLWLSNFKPTKNLDNAEKKLIGTLLQVPQSDIPWDRLGVVAE